MYNSSKIPRVIFSRRFLCSFSTAYHCTIHDEPACKVLRAVLLKMPSRRCCPPIQACINDGISLPHPICLRRWCKPKLSIFFTYPLALPLCTPKAPYSSSIRLPFWLTTAPKITPLHHRYKRSIHGLTVVCMVRGTCDCPQ